jgi:hypothetical protein
MTRQSMSAPGTALKASSAWTVLGILVAAAVVTGMAAVPYLTTVVTSPESGLQQGPATTLILLIGTVLQNVLGALIMGGLGLRLGARIGLGAPDLAGWIAADPVIVRQLPAWLRLGIAQGALIGGLAIVVELLLRPFVTVPHVAAPIWQALLVSFHAGINEEILFRLGCLTIFAWLGCKLVRRERPSERLLWTANLATALLFVGVHLPQAIADAGVVWPVIVYVTLVNGIGSLVLGRLYWQYGLLTAMGAHIAADIVLHALWPLV